ncbi:hypothetical protein PV10_06634 [Exophiala mesophila]|uniref:Ataxin-10 homolog n=1 Tax=Exophiala mesophila TaxID=212818 RepID=A0A0D1ZE06_EXOME|nr:uncharacterized protein PV10_06634 [Exophiala mesophila]KIV92174.1 hypothetical protein PV10_06634 [Exophiala mesophila]
MAAATLLLRMVLMGTQAHYEFQGRIIDEKRLDHLLVCGKQILFKSHQESDVRSALGSNPKVWEGLAKVLTFAIPVLEQQSFAWKGPDPSNIDNNRGPNSSSSELIASHYPSLVKDIERLNDLCTIARNLLATTKKAQNLASEKAFDQQILKLIDVCVKVTARGFDGPEVNPRSEERWQKVVNLYKRLLITCLQFLHNFIMHNEQRKLVLWLDLFGQSRSVEDEEHTLDDSNAQADALASQQTQAAQEERIRAAVENLGQADADRIKNGELEYSLDDVHALFDLMSTNKNPDPGTREAAKILMDKIKKDLEATSGLTSDQLDNNPDILLKYGAELRDKLAGTGNRAAPGAINQAAGETAVAVAADTISRRKASPWNGLPDFSSYGDINPNQTLTEEDLTMPRTAQSAAATLQEAKDELMARLHESQGYQDSIPFSLDEDGNPVPTYDEDDLDDSGDEESVDEDEEDDEDDYGRSSDQERGLLTDVPLVLGPTEIEALPMIIQAGIVDNFGSKEAARNGGRNMQAVRCHILLAQEAGRNVLRELLIFIAAWDLPDDEFYFKMMVQIMEAILKNGLMSHAYADFGQPKDIISPAQAVVIKILTHIFRSKYSPAAVVQDNNQSVQKTRIPSALSRVDVLTVRYIFIVFRGNIIPETCALIYLQGQIRAGLALAEDFPLNLWDMERVYEGVYQFLEFFAVLTENNDWKRLLVQWEIVYDLVTLIKELDASIAKVALTQTMPAPTAAQSSAATAEPSSQSSNVERPYDPSTPATTNQVEPSSATSGAGQSRQSPPPAITEEPADFEWRNLKKLIVLVLSSLVWKSPTVQNQIREYGGVETILSCTQYDACNPYIKEHAIMCLKFLLEANPENQKLVSSLEAREVVPNGPSGREELERMGVDVSLSEEGKVKVSGRSSTRSASGSARRNEAMNRERQREKIARERMEQLTVNDGVGEFDEEVDFM